MPTERIFGLDGEMSGTELGAGHKLIQVGVAVDTGCDGTPLDQPELFCSLIGWPDDELVWDERAAEVHRLPREAVLAAPPATEVDEALYAWLLNLGVDPDERRLQIPCGFSVGSFDMPFVGQALPRSWGLFSRRYADLNAVMFALGRTVSAPISGSPSPKVWKRRLKKAGLELVRAVGRTEGEHDAGTDALIALGAWREVERTLRELDDDSLVRQKNARARRLAAAKAGRNPDIASSQALARKDDT